jgi:hypothetical protein
VVQVQGTVPGNLPEDYAMVMEIHIGLAFVGRMDVIHPFKDIPVEVREIRREVDPIPNPTIVSPI